MNNLIFVDTLPHFSKSKELLNHIERKSTFITTNKEIFLRMKNLDCIYLPKLNFFSLFKLIFRIKRNGFTSICIARTDSLIFQILYIFCSFKEIITFDEGLYSINKSSIYNSQFKIERKFHTRLYLLNKLIDFPIPAAFFYKINTRHYTWLPLSAFSDSIIDKRKIKQLTLKNDKCVERIKIMIGQPWQFMYLKELQIERIFNYVNSNNFNIYLKHPKEDSQICKQYLDDDVPLINSEPDSEVFLKNINTGNLEIYTLTSTLSCNIAEDIKINIVRLSQMDIKPSNDQKVLLKTLERLNKSHNIIQID